jgi:hypothetical protein
MRHVAQLMLLLGAVGCRPAHALGPATQPMPWFASRLGEPCSEESTWNGGVEHCTAGRISYVIRTNAHQLITGRAPGRGCCSWGVPCREYGFEPVEQGPRLAVPSRHLATRTLARSFRSVNEERVYVDGAHLWFVGVYEVGINCYRGTIVVADRRLLSKKDRDSIRKLLSLAHGVDLDDDSELERALKALPSVLPGSHGSI